MTSLADHGVGMGAVRRRYCARNFFRFVNLFSRMRREETGRGGMQGLEVQERVAHFSSKRILQALACVEHLEMRVHRCFRFYICVRLHGDRGTSLRLQSNVGLGCVGHRASCFEVQAVLRGDRGLCSLPHDLRTIDSTPSQRRKLRQYACSLMPTRTSNLEPYI